MKMFISYRRAEDNKSYIVGTIHERLSKVFGNENVFRDTYDIPAGTEWRARLQSEVNACRVMLVVIGPDWASLTLPNGQKRLFDPEDVTRWEVETGLRRSQEENITLIPVLVQDARLPGSDELPPSLHDLSKKQGIAVRNFPDFNADMERLIQDIRKVQGFLENDIKIDPRFEPKTIYIEEGSFWMGSPDEVEALPYEMPQHEVYLPSYRIGKYPVTNAQYEVFTLDTRRQVSPVMGWDGQRVPPGLENHPAAGVAWYEALAYCQWLSEKTERAYSLPNEAQWEKACRGGNNFLYPWGNEERPGRSNQDCAKLAAVDAYPVQNEFGIHDLVGNIRQWTATLWGENRVRPDAKYAYPWKDDQRNNIHANSQIRRVVRGSSMKDAVTTQRCSFRNGEFPDEPGLPDTRHGFRVVMNL